MQLNKKFQLVTVSNATLRSEDLIEAFSNFYQWNTGHFPKVEGLIQYFRELENGEDHDQDSEMWILDELFNKLDSIAPAECYFGSHPGDGACIGYWPDEESDLWK